jgi:hypothetical protein
VGKSYRVKDGKLQMIETSEMDIELVAKVIKYMSENNFMIEFRGQAELINGISRKDMFEVEAFGLVTFIEDAFHTSWQIDKKSIEVLKMIDRELSLHILLKDDND